jgi:hypothetical protein
MRSRSKPWWKACAELGHSIEQPGWAYSRRCQFCFEELVAVKRLVDPVMEEIKRRLWTIHPFIWR